MAVLFRLTKNNNKYNAAYGKWYAQSVMTETIDTDQLATIMQRNCTVKKSDILAVITELIETMQDQLQNQQAQGERRFYRWRRVVVKCLTN